MTGIVRLQHGGFARQVEVPQPGDPETQRTGPQHGGQQAALGSGEGLDLRIGTQQVICAYGIVRAGGLPFPSLVDEAATLATPWLGLFGDLDKGIPVDDVEQLRDTLETAKPVDFDVVRYADADHGFHCDARPAVYNEAAATDGWARALAWIDTHLA